MLDHVAVWAVFGRQCTTGRRGPVLFLVSTRPWLLRSPVECASRAAAVRAADGRCGCGPAVPGLVVAGHAAAAGPWVVCAVACVGLTGDMVVLCGVGMWPSAGGCAAHHVGGVAFLFGSTSRRTAAVCTWVGVVWVLLAVCGGVVVGAGGVRAELRAGVGARGWWWWRRLCVCVRESARQRVVGWEVGRSGSARALPDHKNFKHGVGEAKS